MRIPTRELQYVRNWITDELVEYVYTKFNTTHDREKLHDFSDSMPTDVTWWDTQLMNYLDRAKVLGLENPAGRQALAKFVATANGMLIATVMEFGVLPQPGVASGSNLTDLRQL